ncbi:MAG: Rrf2 family transcriptional regulator [Dehalococcoidia bacterium]|nr:Rrf2 family transcriptional regulator [Dehalococcoidia bacterium]
MKLSNKAEYAMRALLDLALHCDQDFVHTADIAGRTNIPVKFLEQILLALKASGVVGSRRGVGGGYYLARPPQAITVGDVVRILDGPMDPISCISSAAGRCSEQQACSIRSVWVEARDAMAHVLDRTSFADLAVHSQRLATAQDNRAMYHI